MSYTNKLDPTTRTRLDYSPRVGICAARQVVVGPSGLSCDPVEHLEPEELTVRLNDEELLLEEESPSSAAASNRARRLAERLPSAHASTHVRETRPESIPASARSSPPEAERRDDAPSAGASLLRGPAPMILTGVILGFSLFTIARLPLGTPAVAQAHAAFETAPAPAHPGKAIAPPLSSDPNAEAIPPPVTTAADSPKAHSRSSHHRKSGAKRAPSCDPPFRFDSNGIKRIKLRCL